jgi:multidrug resistance protein
VSNTVNRSDVGFRSERGPILIALMVTTGLVAIDATILATAVSSIVDDLGSFALFPWLFSIYLLAQAVSVPIYAKLSDMVGRKPIMLIGIALFLLGSILCGFAWSMPALIAFRAVQGLGAGAVQPMSVTIAGDIYTVAERAKTQGYLASVWGISSVVGPTLGGVFSQFLSWRWIFFINVPLCLIAAFMIYRAFHESIERKQHKVDYLGAGLLAAALSSACSRAGRAGHGTRPRASAPSLSAASSSSSSCSPSERRPSRSSRCGSSIDGCCSRPRSSPSVVVPSSSDSPRTCRRTSSAPLEHRRSWRALPSRCSRSGGRSRPRTPDVST